MLSISTLDEAIAYLSEKTGRPWTESEFFDMVTTKGIQLRARVPAEASTTVYGDGFMPKHKWQGRSILAVLFQGQIARLWICGETTTWNPLGNPCLEEKEFELFDEPVRVTRSDVRVPANSLREILRAWSEAHTEGARRRRHYPAWVIESARQAGALNSEQGDTAHSGAQEVTPVDDGGQGKAATLEKEQKAPIGIPKGQILAVDWPLPTGAPPLQNIIDNLSKWVEEACTKVGRAGKGPNGSHLWNPAILAFCLATKTPQKQWAAGKGALTLCLRRSFPDYLDQWEEAAKSL